MESLFRYFVPRELQSTIAQEYRARVLVATCLVAVALLVPFLIARGSWQGITHAYTLTLIWAMLALQVTPFILRASRSVHVAGMFLTLNIVASGTVMCLTDGGLYSPTVIWLPTVPVMGLFFTTRRFSILIAMALLASVVLLLCLHLTSSMPASPLDPEMVNLLHAGSMAAVTCVVFVQVTTFLNWQQAMQTELRTANTARNEFLSGMSHELRTPLNSIMGFSEVLEKGYDGELNEQQLEYVAFIQSSGNHLLALIEDLLDLSRIDSGRLVLQRGPHDLEELLTDSCRMVQSAAQEAEVHIELHPLQSPVCVCVDPTRFRQIIVNLLTNAARFSPGGSSVWIEGRVNEESVEVMVTDCGPGISASYADRVFERFFRIDEHQQEKGAGLGLFISRNLAALHGGTLTVDRDYTDGCRVVFRLPASQPSGDNTAAVVNGVRHG